MALEPLPLSGCSTGTPMWRYIKQSNHILDWIKIILDWYKIKQSKNMLELGTRTLVRQRSTPDFPLAPSLFGTDGKTRVRITSGPYAFP